MFRRTVAICSAVVLPLLWASPASAQANLQLWGNLTLDWVKDAQLLYELEIEPKVLVDAPDDEPGWFSLDFTPKIDYTLAGWLDVIGETMIGLTKQSDDVNSLELSPRVGARFHVFSRDKPIRVIGKEQHPTRRIVVRDLLRLESRNLFYSGADHDSQSSWRSRNRLEVQIPINTPKLTDDGTRYATMDWEWFMPIQEQDERFSNQHRIRMGVGYRRNFNWRVEGLYVWTRSRNTLDAGFSTADNIIDIRVKRVF